MAIRKLMLGSSEAMQREPSLEPPDIPETRYIICRHPEGISLNGYEWVCDDDGKEVPFETPEDAIAYMCEQNPQLPQDIDREVLEEDYGVYIKVLKYDKYGVNPYEESANE